jgi:hypothetical protein
VRPRENGCGWLTCGDGQIALGDGYRRHPHVASHHDHAGTFVDDDLGRQIRLDLQLLDLGHQRHHVAMELGRDGELDGRGIEWLGGRRAEEVVHRRGDALGGGEVGVAQREPQLHQPVERELDLALDDRAVRDAPDGGNPAGDLGGVALRLKAGHR